MYIQSNLDLGMGDKFCQINPEMFTLDEAGSSEIIYKKLTNLKLTNLIKSPERFCDLCIRRFQN